ncbi:Oidioi.mRNA.OKI2018_I69.chr2.g7552.t1.cds [Oikopleura dioica]|uniref:Oidioi.mRNA.OKI2018_I69.chr2.g7552.t1.cds n=1 Tax=Oikopleura dioica TaxID=34765 RepID=A0ABN7TB63_OIKDI|nr:Oidioi.mRNA.OKI2018_I69.chr2.g7552.t1.cds [Oikopleura dioica]
MRGYTVTPRVAPVCGGIDLIIEGIDNQSLKRQEKTTLLAIEGSRQRHICSTIQHPKIPNAVVCAVPEHEPAEECSLSLIFFGTVNECIEIIPIGRLKYQTDQTQLLAVYLAKSVHDVESLEDWDEIRGTGFSLCDEDFATLDDRLCAAFHHLLLLRDAKIIR